MNKELTGSLAWALGLVALAIGATLARKLGYIDGETVTRLVIGANGLMIAWYGNRMPKVVVPSFQAYRAARVGGWSMVLSGIVYAGLFAFAPLPVAIALGCGAVAGGIIVTVLYCLALRGKTGAA